jgi:hypothetical protein
MTSKLPLLAGAGAMSCIVVYVFARWERTNREHWVVYLLLGLIVFDSVLYANQTLAPRGLLHPGSGSFEFRLPEVIITLALVARLVAKGAPRVIGLPALLWLAVGAWWAVEAVEGLIHHNSTVKLPYEAKAIVYVVGAYALAAGVPIRKFLEGRGLQRLLRWSALGAVVLLLMTLDHHRTISLHVPLLPLVGFGQMGTDAATVFVVVGVLGFVIELAKERRNALNLACVVPLAASPFFAYQRAVLLTLGAVVTVIVLVALGSTARRRLRVRASEVALAALAVVGVVLGVSVVPALTSQGSFNSPLTTTIRKQLETTLTSEAKVESAQSRINKWSVALKDAEQHPVLGEGLGFTYSYFTPGPNVFTVTDLTENIGLDLWLRTGLVGVALFLAALLSSLVNGFAAWRMHPDRLVAVLALALLAVVVGMVAKGQVESIFDNYRLATVLGLSLGMLRAAVTSGGGGLVAMRVQQAYRHYEAV